MQPISHYFIILSEHNIAEYRACLHLQPQNLHLVVTEWITGQNTHTRFKNTLAQSGKFHGAIHEIGFQDHNKLIGEHPKEIQNWLDTAFKQHCAAHQIKHNAILNITGGTKILSQFLAAYPDTWQELHYQAFQRNSDHINIDRLHSHTLKPIGEITLSNEFSLTDGLKLYADEVKHHSPNPITQQPDSPNLARLRFAAQKMQHPEGSNLFPAVIPALEKAWAKKYPEDQKEIHIGWQEFAPADPETLKPFLNRLIKLIPAQNTIRLEENGLVLPTKYKNKTNNQWKKWISGEWFEQLILDWFKENGVADNKLETGLQISLGEGNGNEIDILLFHKNQLTFCELKSDLDLEKNKLTDPLKQLLDQSHNLGKVRRALILSPKIKEKCQAQASGKEKWMAFERSCTDKKIQIIIAENKEALKILTP